MSPGTRLNVGLIGLGRLGRVYAACLSSRIPQTRLVAVCDPQPGLASEISETFEIPSCHADSADLIANPGVDAVVIASPTHTHKELALLAARGGKPTFCEKPPSLDLASTREMMDAVRATGVFFQVGFMRRFDPGYVAAKAQLEAGRIGRPVLFKSTSRDPYRTSLEYADPKKSGGMILDMGIHDFDLARFFMGEVASVSAIGGALAYPELKTVGDIDNAVVSLVFQSGALGVVDLSRNGVYGYDIATELLGDAGALRIGYLRETPLLLLTKNSVSHDTVPHFMERFDLAYSAQLANFARNVLAGRPAPLTLEDGFEALRIAVAAQRSLTTGRPVDISAVMD